MEAALQPQDCVITAYREHCNQLARGGTIHNVMAELTGRVTGISKGKGGSMHMYSREHNFFGGNGIVGAQVPVGAGLAFALKYQAHNGLDRSAVPVPACSVSMFGDGAANQGQIYEAMNMSMLWHLPAIFVCENNHYAMGTSTKRHSSTGDDFYNRYPTPGIRIDGVLRVPLMTLPVSLTDLCFVCVLQVWMSWLCDRASSMLATLFAAARVPSRYGEHFSITVTDADEVSRHLGRSRRIHTDTTATPCPTLD